ncbi:Spy/CpxP family protein refolding chaperone [Xanthobacter sp. KR7-65]|uniref:Spy/CpxP family protein refolding chaperone n=1 Tax=Xanthobacter sp. KR7-65 TaxID=3156612 RepID=UPI0032B4E5E5
MKRAVIAATVAALLAGSAVTYAANNGPAGPAAATDAASSGPGRWKPSPEDRAIFTDARIAALKTTLKLTPDQEKLWPGVEQTLKDVAKERAQRMQQIRADRQAARQANTAVDPIARMRTAADRMDARATDLRKIADAADPLYKTLDTDQKQRLNALLRQQFKGMGGHRGFHEGPRRG